MSGQVEIPSESPNKPFERHNKETSLAASEQRLQALMKASSDIVYQMNSDWTEMRYLNGKDFLPDTTIPTSDWFEVYIPPDEHARVNAAISEAITTQSIFALEHRVFQRDGSVGWTQSRAVPITNKNGILTEWFGAANNITERKQSEAALRKANAQLHDLHKRKDEFLAALSHELRNPLTPIAGGLYIAEHAPAGSEQAKAAITTARRQLVQMRRLVDDLLDSTRIASGKFAIQPSLVELNDLTRQVVEDYQEPFKQRRLHLGFEASAAPLYVLADETRLMQAVGNLLDNAMKFSKVGGSTWVTLNHDSARHSAMLSVEDDGIGISPALLPSIFEPFSQISPGLDRRQGGLGLGLALVQQIAHLHGGTATVHSEGTNLGTRFTLDFPTTREPTAKQDLDSEPCTKGRRILIVEDNADIADTLQELLTFAGHEVETAANGLECLQQVRRNKPDVVICDIGLPEMDGYQVAQTLRSDAAFEATYLIALSGYASKDDIERAKRAGFDNHLAKPPDFDRLQSLVAGGPYRDAPSASQQFS